MLTERQRRLQSWGARAILCFFSVQGATLKARHKSPSESDKTLPGSKKWSGVCDTGRTEEHRANTQICLTKVSVWQELLWFFDEKGLDKSDRQSCRSSRCNSASNFLNVDYTEQITPGWDHTVSKGMLKFFVQRHFHMKILAWSRNEPDNPYKRSCLSSITVDWRYQPWESKKKTVLHWSTNHAKTNFLHFF